MRSAARVSSKRSSRSALRARAAERLRLCRRPSRTRFSRPVRRSSSVACWPANATCSRTALGSRTTSWPPTSARPPSGVSSVTRMRTAVVLPAPLWPSRPRASPGAISRSMPASASVSPKRFVRPSAKTAGPLVSYSVRFIVRRTVTYTVRMSSDHPDDRRRERQERAQERRARAGERRERGRARSRARHALSTDAIVETALRIADEDGLDAVSMRRIASELRVGTMSLYHHVGDKDELLELMADAISAELIVPGEILGDWRAALRALAHNTRDTFLCHPWLIDSAGQRPLVTPNQLRHIEQSIAIVADLDVDRDTAIGMVMSVDDYTIGYVFRRSRFARGDRPAATDRDRERVRELLDTGEFPRLAEVYRDQPDLEPPGDTFDLGLEWMFTGMQAVLDARRG